MTFYYIRKKTNGITVWLKRTGPAIIWGPKDQALKFTALGVARMTLRAIPKSDGAEIETGEAGAPPSNGSTIPPR